ncbi:thiamine pyrophosphate-binding protein [Lysinibacillus sp. A4]|uniref:thiamine pyrophosphate-binding protein n=1 Tax=Lysinibacillus sp. A4 TaxID=2976269 RepID=UPI00217607B0|nr:thiamine pyrophosphate-binding protein [Lysinibacillus sp. A4]MCS5503261.1 thiamine pyrophosphate-binding protein [Lysinibacillus sp. A4]
MARLADYVIERLHQEGINHVFMVTGRGILYLSDAVARKSEIEAICTHHEQGAAFATVAYSEATNNLGVCMVSTGCASTNAITSVLCAWQDNIPCVFISGQNKLNETTRYTNIPIRTFGNQEADIISIVKPITKYATMITDPTNIAYEIDKAFHLATSGRKGPVWIDIPLDIQNKQVNAEELERYEPESTEEFLMRDDDIEFVKTAINAAERPIILIGSGVKSANAVSSFEKLIEKIKIPVVFSSSNVDAFGANNSMSLGAVASIGGSRSANFALQNSDLLIVIGCRLSPQLTGEEYNKFARAAKIVVVDIDEVEHSKNTVKIDKFIKTDAGYFIESLLDINVKQTNSLWINKCLHWKKIFPKCEDRYLESEKIDLYYFAKCLSETAPSNAIVMTDSGLTELIIPSTFEFKKGQRCIHSPSQGSMGFALPGAIGAYCATKLPVLAVIGDGSIMMNLQELQTINYHKMPIKIFVVNNNLYSVIRTRQEELFRSRTIGTDRANGVGAADFKKIADCFGLEYIKIEKSDNISEKLKEVYDVSSPVLCEIIAVEDQKYLHNSFALNEKRRVVRRSLEDQKPFLDREIFLREMLIEPIDQ